MACCYLENPNDCGEYCVTPMLDSSYPTRCSEDSPRSFPCIPRCSIEMKQQKTLPHSSEKCENCSRKYPSQQGSPCWPLLEPAYATRCSENTPRYIACMPQCPIEEKQEKTSEHSSEKCERFPHDTHSQQRRPCCMPHCCPCHEVCPTPVKTKYVIPCYRYEDGRIVRKLPVTAFKRNGMQDQEHSKTLGTANFLKRYPQDVTIECDDS